MTRIVHTPNDEARHFEFYKDANLIKRVGNIRAKYKHNIYGVHDYLDAIKNFGAKRLLIGSVSCLAQLVATVEQYLPKGSFYRKKKENRTRCESVYANVNKELLKVFDYKAFMRHNPECEGWGGVQLALLLAKKVKFCPYCNAETVASFEFRCDGKLCVAKTAFDHFYPRARYPFLGLALYNLIPACNRCNSRFKSDKIGDLRNTYHPFATKNEQAADFHDGMKFLLVPNKAPRQSACDKKDFAGIVLAERHLGAYQQGIVHKKSFRLDEVYSKLYLQDAVDVYWKANKYPESYIQTQYAQLKDSGMSRNDLERLIYGAPLSREEINSHRLGKLILDIVATYR